MTTHDTAHTAGRVAPWIAAVVLAAGRSSRMGTSKPLLPLGEVTAIERVVTSLRAAGVGQVVVVTGHQADALLPVIGRLWVDRAHNPDYDSGMFSSVQAGVAALAEDVDAFFVLPVDCPLVTPRVLRLLAARFRGSDKGILYPICLGRRGHPPLLSARYIRALLEADRTSNLQDFLGAYAADEADIDVRDLTVLLDMDTPEEHEMLHRLAAIIDGEESPLSTAEALFILAATGAPANVVEHCEAVAAVGERLAHAVKLRVPALDVDLVRTGGLLHDMVRLSPDHAALAQEILTNLGLPRLGEVVGRHMTITPGLVEMPGITESELVYLADKLVAGGEVVGLDEREARALRKTQPDPDAAARIGARMQDARLMAEKVAALVGRPFDEILGGTADGALSDGRSDALDSADTPRELSIFLARHAIPAGPAGRRFLGQADPELGAAGVEQAERLARKLMAMTGGACFDAVFSSDLSRCLRTAEIAAKSCGTAVQAQRWLREIDVGEWEGLSWQEARQAYPVEHRERENDVVGRPFPGGESFEDLRTRVIPEFIHLIDASLAGRHRRVLVVAHRGVNRVILAHFLGIPLQSIFSIEQDYCAVTELRAPLSGR